jgi:SnoaL-like domain
MTWAERLDVIDVVYRFAAGIDGKDWVGLRSVFTDEITRDYSSWRADSVGASTADEWVTRLGRTFPGLDASQHCIMNPRATVAGDEATVESYVRAEHALDGDLFSLGGHYTHRLRRASGEWRIHHVTLRVAWTQGDRALMARAVERAAVIG